MTAPDPLFLEFQAALAGRYSLERELGRGGMGVVYLAREVRLDRPVAIKVLPPGRATDPVLRERFLREARTAAKLSHPNILPIFAVDEVGPFVFFAMGYVEGETLTSRLRIRGALPAVETARVLREIAWALAYAHAQGVVHRDVKPDNILLEAGSGRALVTDFGIAAVVRDAAGLDGGEVIGTPEFMSPEQALGEPVDGRSDLYALGVVGFLMVTGRLPFQAAKATEMLAKQVTETPPPVLSIAPVPRRLAQAIDDCLAKQRDDRPASAEAVADRLGLALERRDFPMPVRLFITESKNIAASSIVYTVLAGLMIGPTLVSIMVNAPGVPRLLAGVGLVLLVSAPGIRQVVRVRRLLGQGGTREDLVAALKADVERRREELAFAYGATSSRFERVLRRVALGGVGVSAVCVAALALLPRGASDAIALPILTTGAVTATVLAGLSARGMLERRVDVKGERRLRFWRGRFGKLFTRLAGWGVTRPAVVGQATYRPTELAIGMAADKLFEELPKDTRRRLRELPDALRRLESDAGRMRRRLEELHAALGPRGGGGHAAGTVPTPVTDRRDRIARDLEGERDRVQQRLSEVVAALETIRLNLLKLHAGSGTVERITTDLGLARDVAREVDLLLQGSREVDDFVDPTSRPGTA